MSLSLDGKPLGCAFHILSDVFDILSHIAYDRNMKTRQHRAEVGRRRVEDQFDPKVVAFLDYILESYVESGADQLDRSKLADFARIKYGTLKECGADLGGTEAVISAFVGFQQHLYRPSN
jgi:type I restriction enzyme R subunit